VQAILAGGVHRCLSSFGGMADARRMGTPAPLATSRWRGKRVARRSSPADRLKSSRAS
jgi:hypothetical protein